MNIFEVMQRVSRKVEPYHAHFLAEVLRVSQVGDRRFFDAFWRLAAPDLWPTPERAIVHDEDVLVDGRIDIVLMTEHRHILGIEVKTADASCKDGQLKRYLDGLRTKYPASEYAIAYLTPFNRARAGAVATRLPSVRQYELFSAAFDQCCHVSWLDVADIGWEVASRQVV